jgi:hypothetical protein
MKSTMLNWIGGIALVLALPIGFLCAFYTGSLLLGIVHGATVIIVVLIACRKDIIGEYKGNYKTS